MAGRHRFLPAESHRRMPWKNGGGVTSEIAVWPEGAGMDDFDWRVSMAQVDSDGPFSGFAGVDRTLAILKGEGLRLEIEGREPVTLTGSSTPYFFPADLPTQGYLTGGPIVDLNVMSRRGRVGHSVARIAATAGRHIPAAGQALLLCAWGEVRGSLEDEDFRLGPLDALLCLEPALVTLAGGDGELFAIEFRKA